MRIDLSVLCIGEKIQMLEIMLNACVSSNTMMEIIKNSKLQGIRKSTYARNLLEHSLEGLDTNNFVIAGVSRTTRKKNGYITIRVSVETYQKVKTIAAKKGYTIPTLSGYLIEKA